MGFLEKRALNGKLKILEKQVEEYQNILDQKSGEFVDKKDITEMRQKIEKLTVENISYKKINEGQTTKFLKQKSRHLKESTKAQNTIKDQVQLR